MTYQYAVSVGGIREYHELDEHSEDAVKGVENSNIPRIYIIKRVSRIEYAHLVQTVAYPSRCQR
jgi:acetaldehyde dehydrogenase (acetylating)